MEKPWENQYYHELKVDKRKKMLDDAIAYEGMSPENELRQKLLEARYGKSLGRGRRVDFFIRGWVTLSMLPNSVSPRNKKKRAREIQSIMDDWKFELASEYGETGKRILYEEFCNMTLAYIDTCRHDKTYGAVILGMGRISEDSMMEKIARDVFNVAYSIPEELGISEDLKIFTQAATAMVCEAFPDIEEEFLELVSQKK